MVEFRVGFEAISHLSIEDLSRAFYEEFDGVLAEHGGRINVSVYLEATSAVAAAFSTLRRLERMHFSVCRVDPDLVDGPEVAARLGVTRQAVQGWAKGSRGSGFPHPIGFPGGKRVWAWSQIAAWAREQGRTDEPLGLSLDEAAIVDAFLAERRRAVSYRAHVEVGRGSMKSQAGQRGVDDYTDSRKLSLGGVA